MSTGAVVPCGVQDLCRASYRAHVVRSPTVPLLHAFDLYDSRAVMFGTQTATALITDPREVAEYESHWSELDFFVSYGDEARAVFAHRGGLPQQHHLAEPTLREERNSGRSTAAARRGSSADRGTA